MVSRIQDLSSPAVADAVAASRTAVVPFGSIEQHGPHLPCGTDTFAAELVAQGVAERLEALYVPFGPYGVTPIHAGHPGTINLRRSTFEALLEDICSELISMGIDTFVFVNWHEGNTASLNAVATELQDSSGATFAVAQACYTAQRIYAAQGGELTHGGGIETMSVMAHDPTLVDLSRAGEPSRPADALALDEMRRSSEVYGFITDVTLLADEGWYGNPHWATQERAEAFVETVSEEILKRLDGVLAAQRGHAR